MGYRKESRRLAKGITPEQLSLRLLGSDIPLVGKGEKMPTIGGSASSRSFTIPMQVRNDSSNELTGISHVYLFSEQKAGVVPCEYDTFGNYSLLGLGLPKERDLNREAKPIDSFAAVAADAHDKLVRQFRLPTKFPGMPPGAVETTSIDMMFADGINSTNSLYRLRIHTARQYHDFAFNLKLDYVAQATPVTK